MGGVRVIPSATHLVLIPAHNAGPMLRRTVAGALAHWRPVWVVDDGSTDGSAGGLEVRVIRRDRHGGKGAAVRDGLLEAERDRFTHVLVLDADGQHPVEQIPVLMARSVAQPRAMILGQPRFESGAAARRALGRQVANAMTAMLTIGYGVGDALFGFRVYPIRPLLDIIQQSKWMQRLDFDPEALIRLAWRGVTPVKVPVPVTRQWLARRGASRHRHLRENILLAWTHLRLLGQLLSKR